jgi:hypothetical protein
MVMRRDESDNAVVLIHLILVWVVLSVVVSPLLGRLFARQDLALAEVRGRTSR